MGALSRIGQLARRFGRSRGGNFAMMMGLTAPVLVLAAGYGINLGQVSLTKSNLLAALDSAVTSTARDLTTGAITHEEAPQIVEAFLIANGLRAYAEEGRLSLDSLVIDRLTGTVSAKASVELDVAFALFGAGNTRKVTAESAAVYSDKQIEVSMMLDVTGSMSGGKIRDLRTAASNAVSELLSANKNGGSRVRISLVPYAAAVNVGALATRTVFQEQRNGPDLPTPNWVKPASVRDDCATERKLPNGDADFSDLSPYATRLDNQNRTYQTLVNRDDRLSSCPSARVVPLTANERQLQDAIRNFRADGYTGGGIAAQWGYYMLSPNWRQAISDSGLGDGPADHDPREVAKVAILMTDGEFNTSFVGSGRRPEGGETTVSTNNAEQVCARMKADGIEVFTVGFALPSDEQAFARRVLRNCATPDTGSIRHFHEAANGTELIRVFSEIARNIENLALTK